MRTVILLIAILSTATANAKERRLLYVAEPGVRNYVEHGGVGVLVFDGDNGFKFVKRIPTFSHATPEAVKGVCACAKTARLYVSTTARLLCIDLDTDKPLWERTYEGGCDRMEISPDGKFLYVPSLEGPIWNVVDGKTGDRIARIEPNSGSHNTIVGLDGTRAYLAGLKSNWLYIADTKSHTLCGKVGPFSKEIRPFTVNGKQALCYVNVNDLLGFEVGDLTTGKMIYRVEIAGDKPGPTKRHGCPSHGIALTPDEKELWVTDAANSALHIFDATQMPPKQTDRISLRDQPGWITFSLDGRYAYASTGEVIDAKTRRIVAALTDEEGRAVQSEKVVEILFNGNKPSRNSDQFGLGRKR